MGLSMKGTVMAKAQKPAAVFSLAARPLAPGEYKGYIPNKIVVSLRKELVLKVRAMHRHLVGKRATIRHRSDPDLQRPIIELPHVIVWLLENIELTGNEQPED
jgi:hypothetical protein